LPSFPFFFFFFFFFFSQYRSVRIKWREAGAICADRSIDRRYFDVTRTIQAEN
jgi:hypothetical protein